MPRLRLPLLVGLAATALAVPSAGGAAVSGTITSQTAWAPVATLAPGVTVTRKVIGVAGYNGSRTLTRVSWPLGESHVLLTAAPLAPGGYGPLQHSFAEATVSGFGRSIGALAGINGDTFCPGCANNGGDTLHGLLVHNRQLYANGAGPEVGYTPGGEMIMGSARAVPVRISLPGGTATVADWNALSIPGRTTYRDQVAVLSRSGGRFAISTSYVALTLAGSVSVSGAATTVGAAFRNMLQMAVPYQDVADKATGSAGVKEWVNAYRISQTGGTPVTAAMPVAGGIVSGATVTVPSNGIVLVAHKATTAATGLAAAAARHTVAVTLDDAGWGSAASIMDGKYQMVAGGVARTRYPGWRDSWPWTCQGTGWGCVRAAVGENATRGYLVVVAGSNGGGLTMPDFARVLSQLGTTNAMAFDSNTHADFWRAGGTPITAGGREPSAPAATMLTYH
jgi:hypothetical protein